MFTDACCFYLARWLVARLRPFILADELHLRLFKSRIMFPAFVRNTRMQTFEYERRRSVSRLIPFADTVQLRGVRSPVPMHLSLFSVGVDAEKNMVELSEFIEE